MSICVRLKEIHIQVLEQCKAIAVVDDDDVILAVVIIS